MSDLLWGIALAALVVGLVDLSLIVRRELRARYRLLHRRLLVHTTERATFEGVLTQRWEGMIVLSDVRRWDRGQSDAYPIDGDVVLERERVEWLSIAPLTPLSTRRDTA